MRVLVWWCLCQWFLFKVGSHVFISAINRRFSVLKRKPSEDSLACVEHLFVALQMSNKINEKILHFGVPRNMVARVLIPLSPRYSTAYYSAASWFWINGVKQLTVYQIMGEKEISCFWVLDCVGDIFCSVVLYIMSKNVQSCRFFPPLTDVLSFL